MADWFWTGSEHVNLDRVATFCTSTVKHVDGRRERHATLLFADGLPEVRIAGDAVVDLLRHVEGGIHQRKSDRALSRTLLTAGARALAAVSGEEPYKVIPGGVDMEAGEPYQFDGDYGD